MRSATSGLAITERLFEHTWRNTSTHGVSTPVDNLVWTLQCCTLKQVGLRLLPVLEMEAVVELKQWDRLQEQDWLHGRPVYTNLYDIVVCVTFLRPLWENHIFIYQSCLGHSFYVNTSSCWPRLFQTMVCSYTVRVRRTLYDRLLQQHGFHIANRTDLGLHNCF